MPPGTCPLRPARVVVFPFLSEQGRRGQRSKTPDPRLLEVNATFQHLFPDVRIRSLGDMRGHELDFQASSLPRFLARSWSVLRPRNILVTHRNFIANELLARAGLREAGKIPNAATVLAEVTERESGETKLLLFVRHCVSHQNVTGRDDSHLTTCADVTSLQALKELLCSAPDDVLFGSSALPRAVFSCLALQKPIAASDLERVRRAFSVPGAVAASPAQIEAYEKQHACSELEPPRSYCGAAGGTFRLAPS
jgi:hypothetical protein